MNKQRQWIKDNSASNDPKYVLCGQVVGNRCLYSTLSAKCSQKCDYPGLSCISEIRNVIFSILIRLLKVIEYKDKQTQVTRFMNTERVSSSRSGVGRGKSANI